MQSDELDQYNRIAQAGRWSWRPVELSELPASTREYVQTWLVHFGVKFELHKPVIGDTYVFRLDNDLVHFLIHHSASGSHMWGDANFNNLDNNTVLAHLVTGGGVAENEIRKLFGAIDRADRFAEN